MMNLEQARELRNSALWKSVVNELDHRIQCKTNELIKCDKEDLEHLQADIRRLQELRQLPDDVVDREENAM